VQCFCLSGAEKLEDMRSALAVERANGVKKNSAWAAILVAPTLVGTAHGMNFENMPELSWEYGK
jgi:magnesium transporter